MRIHSKIFLKILADFFYSSGNVTPVRAVSSLSFEDSNAEYGINPYSAYFTFDVFHVTATIRILGFLGIPFITFSSLLKREIIVISIMSYGILL